MLNIAVLAGPWPRLGVLALAALGAATILARTDARRALTMLGALILAPVLLLDDVWHSSQLHFVHRHPLEAAVGAALVLAVLAAAAVVIHRLPWLLGPLAALTLPFRVPISAGGATNYLLVPLYFVIAAAALGWLVPVLRRARSGSHGDGSDIPGDGSVAPGDARSGPRQTHLFERLLAAAVVLYSLQSLYSHDFPKALQNEVFFYIPFAILFDRLRALQWNRQLLIRCLLVTVSLALLFSMIGYVEEATKHLLLSPKLVSANALHEYFTVNSVFFDPNIFGRYLAVAMLLLATVLLWDRRQSAQWGAIVALAMIWVCLIFTLSRSSLVALGLGLAILAALRWRARPVIYAAAVVAVIGVVVVAVHPSAFGLNQGLNSATDGRVNLITGGIRLFGDRPPFGWGSGAFSTEYQIHFRIAARAVSDSHNIAVTIAAEQGIVGLLLYVALIISALVTLFRGARTDAFRAGVAAATAALLLHTMFYADFLEDPTTWALLAIGATLASAAHAAPAAERRDRRRIGRAVA